MDRQRMSNGLLIVVIASVLVTLAGLSKAQEEVPDAVAIPVELIAEWGARLPYTGPPIERIVLQQCDLPAPESDATGLPEILVMPPRISGETPTDLYGGTVTVSATSVDPCFTGYFMASNGTVAESLNSYTVLTNAKGGWILTSPAE